MSAKNSDTLNSLLRGEISAIETYTQALEKFDGSHEAVKLRELRDEHTDSANSLRKRIDSLGSDPATSSGLWGTWAKFVEGTAKIFGKGAALKALKEGEEHGAKSYKDALASEDLASECKTLISSKLLPKCQSHVSSLEGMISKS